MGGKRMPEGVTTGWLGDPSFPNSCFDRSLQDGFMEMMPFQFTGLPILIERKIRWRQSFSHPQPTEGSHLLSFTTRKDFRPRIDPPEHLMSVGSVICRDRLACQPRRCSLFHLIILDILRK
jgi:hypothetical protein